MFIQFFGIFRLLIGVMAFVGLILTAPSQAASFDCAKASTRMEKWICKDVQTSEKDDDLNFAYHKLMTVTPDKNALIKDQRQWLKKIQEECDKDKDSCFWLGFTARWQELIARYVAIVPPEQPEIIPHAYCMRKNTPDYCRWTVAQIREIERKTIEKSKADIQRSVLPYLKDMIPQTYDEADPTNPQYLAYCAARMDKLRAGKFTYFPTPDAKTTEVGYDKVWELRKERAMKDGCDKRSFWLRGKYWQHSTAPYQTEWLYLLPEGPVLLEYGLKSFRAYSEFDQCQTFGGMSIDTAVRIEAGHSGELLDSDGALGLIEIDGELFGIAGGMLMMEHDNGPWNGSPWNGHPLENIYRAFEYRIARQDWVGYKQGYKDKSAAIAAVRILELDPMFPPWKAYYDQMRKPGEQWMMGEAFFGHNKPCTWHTNQLVRLNIPN